MKPVGHRPPRARGLRVAGPLFAALSLASASAGAAPDRGPTSELGRPPEECPTLRPGRQAVSVHGSSVRSRTPGCFFFSGPGALGRNDALGTVATLERGADTARLSFGRAVFAGRERGGTIELERRSEHDFGGPWRVTERMRGVEAQVGPRCRGLRLTYGYEECGGAPCPGPCRIDAVLTVTARR